MKKFAVVLAVMLIVVMSTAALVFAADNILGDTSKPKNEQQRQRPALTDSQKKEIEGIRNQISELKKKLIDKYTEFGVITKEKADQIKERMDKIREKIKEKREDGRPGPGILRPRDNNKLREKLKERIQSRGCIREGCFGDTTSGTDPS